MEIAQVKQKYQELLPVFGEQLCIEEEPNQITFILDGGREEFFFCVYDIDYVHVLWCNECFIFDGCRNALVSSDTYGEIVFEEHFEVEQLPDLIAGLVLQLRDCTFVSKEETIRGKIPSGYDYIKDYVIYAKAKNRTRPSYRLGNITIEYLE